MGPGARESSQTALLALLNYVDNANLFLLELSLAVMHQLENEPFVAKLRQVCTGEFASYLGEINPKNVTRYMNLAKVVDYLAQEVGFASEFKGFDYWRKILIDLGLATRQVEQGGGWSGFGGVHSHYAFTPVGNTFFNLQACLVTSPPIGPELLKQPLSPDTRVQNYAITELILFQRRKLRSGALHPDLLSKSLQPLQLAVFLALGVLFASKKRCSYETLRLQVNQYYPKEFTEENFVACLQTVRTFYQGRPFKPSDVGKLVFHYLGEFLETIQG